MNNTDRILQFLADRADQLSPLLILTHDYPDPDALASAAAFQYLAEEGYQIKSRIVYGGIIGRNENQEMVRVLKMPVHKLKLSDFTKFENVALLDTQPAFGNNSFPDKRKATIVIDQHASVRKPNADLTVVDTELGATSVLIAQTLLAKGLTIPPPLATALTYGILTDTQNLRGVTNSTVINTYATLVPFSDLKKLARIQNPSRSRKFFQTLSRAIQQATVRQRLIVAHLGFVETPDLVSQIADFLLSYKSMNWAFCTGRYNGALHVSLRIKSAGAKAGEVLRDIFHDRGHAGGHGRIAGGKVKVGLEAGEDVWQSLEQNLTQLLAKRLRISAKAQPYAPFAQPEGGPRD